MFLIIDSKFTSIFNTTLCTHTDNYTQDSKKIDVSRETSIFSVLNQVFYLDHRNYKNRLIFFLYHLSL